MVKFESILLGGQTTLKEVMERLSGSPYQIVFVVDSNKKLVGCITDGDVRRAFLRGETLQTQAERVCRKSFVFVKKGTTDSKILGLMREKGVRQIPILDAEGNLTEVKTLDHFVEGNQVSLPVVIMAGGKGTRLLPYTESVPKPLLKIGGQTIIDRLIQNLKAKGMSEFFVTVNYLADQVTQHLGEGEKHGVKIQYVHEPEALGTAGGLGLLREKISTDFLVVNGDVLAPVDFNLLMNFHEQHRADITVCAKLFALRLPYGVVQLRGSDILGIEEKPELSFQVNSGIYMVSPSVFEWIEDGKHLDMPSLIGRMISEGKRVKCFQSTDPWLDIGSHGDYEKAQKFLEYLV